MDPSTQLAVAARAGDAQAFEVMVRPCLEPAFRLALAMLQNRDEAADAVQESLLRAWSRIRTFSPERPFRPWFLTVVGNQCRTRRSGRWSRIVALPVQVREPDPTVVADFVDLHDALRKLGHKDLMAVVMHFYLDLPFEEMAITAGCSTEAIRSRTYRALRKLRVGLQVEEEVAT